MKKLLLYSFLFAVPFCPVNATTEDTEIEAAFVTADIFPNGLIDSGEFDIYNIKTFASLDMDFSNSLDREECMGDCFPNNITMNGTSGAVIRYPFRVLDTNRNEAITDDEYLAHGRNQFKIYDENKDSVLDKKEFIAFYQGLKDRTFIADKRNEKAE